MCSTYSQYSTGIFYPRDLPLIFFAWVGTVLDIGTMPFCPPNTIPFLRRGSFCAMHLAAMRSSTITDVSLARVLPLFLDFLPPSLVRAFHSPHPCSTASLLRGFVVILYDKAVVEPIFIGMYAQMCQRLANVRPPISPHPTPPSWTQAIQSSNLMPHTVLGRISKIQ